MSKAQKKKSGNGNAMAELAKPFHPDLTKLSDLLSSLRKLNNLTTIALGKEFGVGQSYISGIEHGCNRPSKKIIVSYAKYFKIDVKQLLFLAGYLHPQFISLMVAHPDEVYACLDNLAKKHSVPDFPQEDLD